MESFNERKRAVLKTMMGKPLVEVHLRNPSEANNPKDPRSSVLISLKYLYLL